jgi:hypothetical protein
VTRSYLLHILTQQWSVLEQLLEEAVREQDRRQTPLGEFGQLFEDARSMRARMQRILGAVALWKDERSKEEEDEIEAANAEAREVERL